MKNVLNITTICLIALLINIDVTAQKNTSQENNYKTRNSISYSYSTKYDNGYVILTDGTELQGQISIYGASFDKIWGVKIITTSGRKLILFDNSVKEFGLRDGVINETPYDFTWVQKDTKLIDVRKGYAPYGYVNLKDGSQMEGRIELREVKSKLVSIELRDNDKNKSKIDVENITSYGAKLFKDEKFVGPWKLVNWKPRASDLSNDKSYSFKGYMILNNGSRKEGLLTVYKKENIMKDVEVNEEKIDYADIKEYGFAFKIDDYYAYISEDNDPNNVYSNPIETLFAPGIIKLSDDSTLKGLVAKANTSESSDILFAKDKSSNVIFYESNQVDEIEQEVSQEVLMAKSNKNYEDQYLNGYKRLGDKEWKIEKENQLVTVYAPHFGYVVDFKTNELLIGELEVKAYNNAGVTLIITDNNGNTSKMNRHKGYGLLDKNNKLSYEEFLKVNNVEATKKEEVVTKNETNNAKTENEPEPIQFDSSNGVDGYIVLDNGEKIEGKLSLLNYNKFFYNVVQMKTAAGEVYNYENDQSIKLIVVNDGEENKFVECDGAYVPVFESYGKFVHFRNPYPTTLSFAGALADQFMDQANEEASEFLNNEMDKAAIKNAIDKQKKGDWDEKDQRNLNDFLSKEKIKFGNSTLFENMYVKEHLVMNIETGSRGMYLPDGLTIGNTYEMKGFMRGCIEFHDLESDEQKAHMKLKDPMKTLKFLEESFSN
ncbi:hypothetical protein [Fulvivirga lutea]|uniref:WG repeat-containing protein n=1 Tax=Fulvivirga lutea TaxID=2810512 RepID=A0A974WEB3_9BACT|nr:hypothetical protein [Fulvivirga lutea]QSE96466.1 hypothetical protein JR347_12750 [Fulvivirga lutea]